MLHLFAVKPKLKVSHYSGTPSGQCSSAILQFPNSVNVNTLVDWGLPGPLIPALLDSAMGPIFEDDLNNDVTSSLKGLLKPSMGYFSP